MRAEGGFAFVPGWTEVREKGVFVGTRLEYEREERRVRPDTTDGFS